MPYDDPDNKTALSTEQLEARMQQLQKWESLGVLASGIAHDLKTCSWESSATRIWRSLKQVTFIQEPYRLKTLKEKLDEIL